MPSFRPSPPTAWADERWNSPFDPANRPGDAPSHGRALTPIIKTAGQPDYMKKIGVAAPSRKFDDKPAAAFPPVDAILTPGRSKNVTIHVKMDVTYDVDEELEMFSRLRRLGDFRAALAYFNEHLTGRLDDAYFINQYAQLLLDAGDYRTFGTLKPTGIFGDSSDGPLKNDRDLLRVNWNLLVVLAVLHSGDWVFLAWREARNALSVLKGRKELSSTELQILTNVLRVISFLDTSASLGEETSIKAIKDATIEHINWNTLRRLLVSQGRIWEFSDVFMAFVSTHGHERAYRCFFQARDTTAALDVILSDWETEDFDESTALSLLEVVSFLILSQTPGKDVSIDACRPCLDHGTRIAETLVKNSTESLRSRAFSRWLIARAVASDSKLTHPPSSFTSPSNYPGLWIKQGTGIVLPMYVPLCGERPPWSVSADLTPEQSGAIEAALATAKFHQDYETQAISLKVLLLHSKDPRQLLGDLCHLQSSIQEDKDGYLRTCLASFLVCSDPNSQRNLAEDLIKFDRDEIQIEPKRSRPSSNLALHWARRTIQSCMSDTTFEGIPYYTHLPDYIQDFIDAKVSFQRSRRDSEDDAEEPIPVRYREPSRYWDENEDDDYRFSRRRERDGPTESGRVWTVNDGASTSLRTLSPRRQADTHRGALQQKQKQNEEIARRSQARRHDREQDLYNPFDEGNEKKVGRIHRRTNDTEKGEKGVEASSSRAWRAKDGQSRTNDEIQVLPDESAFRRYRIVPDSEPPKTVKTVQWRSEHSEKQALGPDAERDDVAAENMAVVLRRNPSPVISEDDDSENERISDGGQMDKNGGVGVDDDKGVEDEVDWVTGDEGSDIYRA